MFRLGLLFALMSGAAWADALDRDTPSTTSAGTQFVAPAKWSLRTQGAMTVLSPPESATHLALVDLEADSADSAAAAAWQQYDKSAHRQPKVVHDGAPQDGWDQVRDYEYETSANDKRELRARVLRARGRYTVVIEDADLAVKEKRLAQFIVIVGRLLPQGYTRESFAGRAARPLDAARIAQLKDFVEAARRELDIPGVAFGLIDHGRVVSAGGFGVRQLGKAARVDADTLFMIASNTKALTTLMLAREVDAGRFDWDTPVKQLLPRFRLGDADTARRVLMRHLVCACTGLPRQDLEWIFNSTTATPESIMTTLAGMQPTSAFGELYQYSNLMAAAAGYVGGHVEYPAEELGRAYDRAMQREVFGPLGMHSTTFNSARAQSGNHAEPHGVDIAGRRQVAAMGLNRAIYAARPAGAAWSNIHDMLRYLQMELHDGLLPDGRRYISAKALRARREPQVAIGTEASYGMGLITDHTWGVTVVHHGGSLLGYRSDMMWLPGLEVGAAILINDDYGWAILAPLRRRLLEVLFDGRPLAQEQVAAAARGIRQAWDAERPHLVLPADPAAAALLATAYRNPLLGSIRVQRAGGRTLFDFGGWHSEMASRRNDDGSLSFVTASPGATFDDAYEFVVADRGEAKTLVLRDAQHEYRYAAVVDQAMPRQRQ